MKNTTQNTIDIIKKLKTKNQTITFAESCTGGRIAAQFTAISGASSVLMGSAVTYANEIKSAWLGVQEYRLIIFYCPTHASKNYALSVQGFSFYKCVKS